MRHCGKTRGRSWAWWFGTGLPRPISGIRSTGERRSRMTRARKPGTPGKTTIPKEAVREATRRLKKAFGQTGNAGCRRLEIIAQQHHLYLETDELPVEVFPGLVDSRFARQGGARRAPLGRLVWTGAQRGGACSSTSGRTSVGTRRTRPERKAARRKTASSNPSLGGSCRSPSRGRRRSETRWVT